MALSAIAASRITKILTLGSASAMIVLGLIRFIFNTDISILAGIWTAYWVQYSINQSIFGLMIFAVEFGIQKVIYQVEFMQGECSKGMFIIFCGTLLIDRFEGSEAWYSIVGVLIMAAGFMIVYVMGSAQPSEKFPEVVQK